MKTLYMSGQNDVTLKENKNKQKVEFYIHMYIEIKKKIQCK